MQKGVQGLRVARAEAIEHAETIANHGLMRAADAEKILGYSRGYLKKAAVSGKLQFWIFWGQDWVSENELERYLESHRRRKRKKHLA
jgi:hypothetical protein